MSLTQDDMTAIKAALEKLDFYSHLKPEEVQLLIAEFEKSEMKKGDVLITQGKGGSIFYIVASGMVGVYLKRALLDKRVAVLGPNSYFGEMSLISDEPRSASVICEADGVVYTLLRDTFRNIIMHNPYIADMVKKTAKERKDTNKAIEFQEFMGKSMR